MKQTGTRTMLLTASALSRAAAPISAPSSMTGQSTGDKGVHSGRTVLTPVFYIPIQLAPSAATAAQAQT